MNEFKADICISYSTFKRLIIPLLITNVKKKFFLTGLIKDLSKYIINQSINQFKNLNFKKEYNLTFKKKIKNHSVFLKV